MRGSARKRSGGRALAAGSVRARGRRRARARRSRCAARPRRPCAGAAAVRGCARPGRGRPAARSGPPSMDRNDGTGIAGVPWPHGCRHRAQEQALAPSVTLPDYRRGPRRGCGGRTAGFHAPSARSAGDTRVVAGERPLPLQDAWLVEESPRLDRRSARADDGEARAGSRLRSRRSSVDASCRCPCPPPRSASRPGSHAAPPPRGDRRLARCVTACEGVACGPGRGSRAIVPARGPENPASGRRGARNLLAPRLGALRPAPAWLPLPGPSPRLVP